MNYRIFIIQHNNYNTRLNSISKIRCSFYFDLCNEMTNNVFQILEIICKDTNYIVEQKNQVNVYIIQDLMIN